MRSSEFISKFPKEGLPKKVASFPIKKSKLSVAEFTEDFMNEKGCDVRGLLYGECEDYADYFVDQFGGEIWVTPLYEEPWGKFYHFFVRRKGKFYDGSVTQGVNNWWELPVFADYLTFQ